MSLPLPYQIEDPAIDANFKELAKQFFPAQVDRWHIIGAAGEPAYQGTWVAYGAPYAGAAFYIDPFARVWLRGMIKTGGLTTVFTLPAGYRPPYNVILDAQSNNALAQISITTAGNVDVAIGNAAWLSLDGLSFSVRA